jgi:hypothetical protein
MMPDASDIFIPSDTSFQEIDEILVKWHKSIIHNEGALLGWIESMMENGKFMQVVFVMPFLVC